MGGGGGTAVEGRRPEVAIVHTLREREKPLQLLAGGKKGERSITARALPNKENRNFPVAQVGSFEKGLPGGLHRKREGGASFPQGEGRGFPQVL